MRLGSQALLATSSSGAVSQKGLNCGACVERQPCMRVRSPLPALNQVPELIRRKLPFQKMAKVRITP